MSCKRTAVAILRAVFTSSVSYRVSNIRELVYQAYIGREI